jgi:cytochrome c oxidase subunit II
MMERAAGIEAEPVATLTLVMLIGAALLFALVAAALCFALFGGPRWKSRLGSERAVIALGIALPILVLSALLIWGLTLTARLVWPQPEDPLRIRVTGKQWWWDVAYLGGAQPTTANEIVIPTGRMAEIELQSSDVIHSFWVPRLAGKIDMIPGKSNRLYLQAERPGIYLGHCAEYCGGPHALMKFRVIALPPDRYANWERQQAAPALAPRSAAAARGRDLFLGSSCAVCHAIRGTSAGGKLGPDLTHVGSRTTIASGMMPNNVGSLAAWIADTQHIKPGNRMPQFRVPPEDLIAVATYLSELK